MQLRGVCRCFYSRVKLRLSQKISGLDSIQLILMTYLVNLSSYYVWLVFLRLKYDIHIVKIKSQVCRLMNIYICKSSLKTITQITI